MARVEEIYEALFDDEALARLPNIMAKAAKARSAMMFWQHQDGVSQSIAYSYFQPQWFEQYNDFAERDPYRNFAVQNINRLILPNEVISPAAFERSAIYNELIRPNHDDTVFCTGSAIRSAWGTGIIGVHRGRTAKPFDKDDAARLKPVIVHVERVLRARGEIASARRAAAFAQGALDAVGLIAITVRADGRVLHGNAAAEAIFARTDGLCVVGGRLSCTDHENRKRLEHAIAAATDAKQPMASAVAVARGPNEPAYLATVTPLVGRACDSAALVLFRDPDMPDHSVSGQLRSLFNLTNAEAAVASDLANGLTLDQIARNRGVRIVTLRSQLKAVAAKTGCNRQAEIVALVRRLPPSGAIP
jgi:DNA-binding CsgD family transcriptional regulator